MKKNNLIALLPAILVFIADQLSKFWVVNILNLKEIGRIDISPIFNLSMVWNIGVSFGALKASNEVGRWGLVVLSTLISIMFGSWLLKTNNPKIRFALSLVIGGAMGNVIDRIRFGAVADFLDFSGLYFPWVFNIADAGVVIGALLLMLDMLLTKEDNNNLNNKNVL